MLQFPRKPLLALSVTTAISLSSAAKANYFSEDEKVSFNSQIVDAVEYSDREGVENLLRLGINPNESGDFGTTSLIRAAYHGDQQMVELLLMAGANPNITDIGGATALHIASREGHGGIVEALTVHGADVNVADNEGNTPLMRASANGHKDAAEILTIAGATVNDVNDYGESAIVYAANSNSSQIVDTLLREGADKNILDEDGYTVEQIAQEKGNEMMVASLSKVTDDHIELIMKQKSGTSYSTQLASAQPTSLVDSKRVLAKLEEDKKINLAAATPTERPKKDWLNGLKDVFDAAGAFELASVKNYEEGSKYILLDLGSFRDQSFAERRISKMKSEHGKTFEDLGLAIIEKGSGADTKYHVNAGILNDKDSALKICKSLVSKGINCRPVETTLITAEQFEKFSVHATNPATRAVKSAKVEAKTLDPIVQAADDYEEVKEVAVKPVKIMPKKAEVEAEIEAVEVAKAVPTPAPAPKALPKVKAMPAPVEEPKQRDFFSFLDSDKEDERKEDQKTATPPADFVKPKKAEVAVKAKDTTELLANNVEEDSEPSLLDIAGMKPAKTEADKKEDQEQLSELIDEINEESAAQKAKEKADMEAKAVARAKTRQLPPLKVEEKPNIEERVSNLASLQEEAPAAKTRAIETKAVQATTTETRATETRAAAVIEEKPVVVARESDLPRVQVAPRTPVEYQFEEEEETTRIREFIKPKETANEVESPEKFRVSKPIRVESEPVTTTFSPDAATQVSRNRGTTVNTSPNEIRSFDRYHNMEEKWVQIDYFESDNVAKAYWSNVYVDANMTPDMHMSAIKLFHTNEIYYSAFIGPFNNKMAAEGFCEDYAPDGTKCRISKRPLNSISLLDSFSRKPSGAGIKGRHSSGVKRGGFIGDSGSSLRNDARDIVNSSSMQSGDWTLQFGSYSSASAARSAWNDMKSSSTKLRSLDSNVVKSSSQNKYRLRAGSFKSRADASYFCDKLKSRAVNCIIVQDS